MNATKTATSARVKLSPTRKDLSGVGAFDEKERRKKLKLEGTEEEDGVE